MFFICTILFEKDADGNPKIQFIFVRLKKGILFTKNSNRIKDTHIHWQHFFQRIQNFYLFDIALLLLLTAWDRTTESRDMWNINVNSIYTLSARTHLFNFFPSDERDFLLSYGNNKITTLSAKFVKADEHKHAHSGILCVRANIICGAAFSSRARFVPFCCVRLCVYICTCGTNTFCCDKTHASISHGAAHTCFCQRAPLCSELQRTETLAFCETRSH